MDNSKHIEKRNSFEAAVGVSPLGFALVLITIITTTISLIVLPLITIS